MYLVYLLLVYSYTKVVIDDDMERVLQVAEVLLEPVAYTNRSRASHSRLVLLRLLVPLQINNYVKPVRLPNAELSVSNPMQCQLLGYALIDKSCMLNCWLIC